MSNIPAGDPRNRVISITVAIVCLVLGALPLAGTVFGMVRSPLHHRSGTPPIIILVFVFAIGFIAISVTILRGLRRGQVFNWLGGGPLNYSLLLLPIILAAITEAEAKTIEHLMVQHGVRPRIADLLTLLPIIAGGLVFAVYWRRASGARAQSVTWPPAP